MSRIGSRLLAVLLLALASPALARGLADLPADAVVVDPLAMSAEDLASARAVAKQARAALASGPAAALKLVASVEDPLRHALAASALIAELQQGEGDPASLAVLQQLTKTPLRVFRRHEETAADWFLPHLDVAGQATFALRLLDARAERQRWSQAWDSDPVAALADLRRADASITRLALEGLELLPAADANHVLTLALTDPGGQSPALWSTLALATGKQAAFGAAARHAEDADLLRLLSARDRLPAPEAVDWLLALAERPTLASAALLALAAYAEHGSIAWSRLLQALDDPALAPSAAAALAQRPHVDRVRRIAALADGASPQRLFGVVLALRLEGSVQALSALDGLRGDPRLPAATRAELLR